MTAQELKAKMNAELSKAEERWDFLTYRVEGPSKAASLEANEKWQSELETAIRLISVFESDD